MPAEGIHGHFNRTPKDLPIATPFPSLPLLQGEVAHRAGGDKIIKSDDVILSKAEGRAEGSPPPQRIILNYELVPMLRINPLHPSSICLSTPLKSLVYHGSSISRPGSPAQSNSIDSFFSGSPP